MARSTPCYCIRRAPQRSWRGLLGAERPASLTVLRALGLSRACTAPLAALPLAGIAAASTPDETALMALL